MTLLLGAVSEAHAVRPDPQPDVGDPATETWLLWLGEDAGQREQRGPARQRRDVLARERARRQCQGQASERISSKSKKAIIVRGSQELGFPRCTFRRQVGWLVSPSHRHVAALRRKRTSAFPAPFDRSLAEARPPKR